MTSDADDPRLLLVVDASAEALSPSRIEAALRATDAVTVVIRGARDTRHLKALVAAAQQRNVAALVENDAALARSATADGVHLTPQENVLEVYEEARKLLGPDAIVGADAGSSRHVAMELGERGADYIAFSRHLDLVEWWSELFNVPVVAFAVATPDEAEAASRHGADFAAVELPPTLADKALTSWARDLESGLERGLSAAADVPGDRA